MRILAILLCSIAIVSGQKTDLATYAVPALPTYPAAGGTYTDSVFKTTVMRITDAVNCPHAAGCWNEYSSADAFTRDNRRLVIGTTGSRYWFDFDPIAFTLGTKHTFPNTSDGFVVQGDFVSAWNPTDPTHQQAYVYDGPRFKIWLLDVVTGTYSLVKTFSSGEMPTATTNFNTTGNWLSRINDVFSFTTDTGCFFWQKTPDSVLHKYTGSEANECQVDQLGLWGVRKPNTSGLVSPIINLTTGTVTTVTQCPANVPTDWAMYHSDFGRGFGIAMNGLYDDCFGSSLSRFYLSMSDLHTTRKITPTGNSSDGHVSTRNDDNEWATFEFYRATPVAGQFTEEVFSASIDGSFRTQRYAHHHTAMVTSSSPYRGQPKAVVSRDGQFITFTTNMGNSAGRTDVFVVRAARRSSTPSTSGMTGAGVF